MVSLLHGFIASWLNGYLYIHCISTVFQLYFNRISIVFRFATMTSSRFLGHIFLNISIVKFTK